MNNLILDKERTYICFTPVREVAFGRFTAPRSRPLRERAILPDVTLIGVGGHSIFDRGREALLPLAEEIGRARVAHSIVIGVGGGTRVRHTISIALDLGLPTGGIAQLVSAMEEANAILLNALLAGRGAIVTHREHFWDLPLYLASGMIPIVTSTPPYRLWEPPPEEGPLPAHGSDFGLFMHAETLGMRRVLFVKDEDGLYTKDPKKHKAARLIRRASLRGLLTDMPEELILDRRLFSAWQRARHVKRVQIINGRKRGELARALAGEDAGTVLEKEDE